MREWDERRGKNILWKKPCTVKRLDTECWYCALEKCVAGNFRSLGKDSLLSITVNAEMDLDRGANKRQNILQDLLLWWSQDVEKLLWSSRWSCVNVFSWLTLSVSLLSLSLSIRWVTTGQNDWALRLPLLQGDPVWEEVRSQRGESLLCEMLREPVLQHLWGVQEAYWLQHQGRTLQHSAPMILSVGFLGSNCPSGAFCRICPTRTVTGTRTVSSASSASARWWTSPSPPRMSSSSAPSATPMSIPPSAMSARRPSCQVGRESQGEHNQFELSHHQQNR